MPVPVLPEQWHGTFFLAEHQCHLAVWNVPPHVDLRAVAVFVHPGLNLLALTPHALARPEQDHARFVLRMPVSGALPCDLVRRQRFVPCTRSFVLTWPLNRDAGRPCCSLTEQALRPQLLIQCDGSGGGRWGVGVHVPSLAISRKFGGDASALPHFSGGGVIDSATVEAMAVVCALYVAEEVIGEGTYSGVLLVVDNTTLVAREISRPHAVARHHRAVLGHVYRRAEILLKRGFAVRLLHKKMFGLGHSWDPDLMARQGRDLEQAPFGEARRTTAPIRFVDPVSGNFLGLVGRDGCMTRDVVGSVSIAIGDPPRRPPPL